MQSPVRVCTIDRSGPTASNPATSDFDRPETLLPALEGVHTVFLVFPMPFDERATVAVARSMVAAARGGESSPSSSCPPMGPATRGTLTPAGTVR